MRRLAREAVTQVGRVMRGTLDELFPRIIDAAIAEEQTPWSPDGSGVYCVRCGASAGPGSATLTGCAFCHDESPAWQRLTRLGPYASPLDDRIRAMKFHRQWQWAPWFGRHLAASVGEPIDARRVVVCPVPMHWLRRWRRGFNQSALMAQAVAEVRGWPVADVLRRTRHTPPQTAVAPSQRPANIRGSFTADPVDLTGYEVILIDDVKTTGATLGACAKLLHSLGAASVHCAVAAVADPQGQHFQTI